MSIDYSKIDNLVLNPRALERFLSTFYKVRRRENEVQIHLLKCEKIRDITDLQKKKKFLLGEEILIFGVRRKEQSHKARALKRGIMPRILQKRPGRG
jgi:hypothetical protein